VQVDIDKIKAFLQTDRAILMGCIGIALIVWLFMKMSQTHETEIPLIVNFTAPDDKIFATRPDSIIKPKISGTGWALFRRYITAQRPVINVDDLSSLPTQTVSASELETLIQRQLPTQLRAGLRSYQFVNIQLDDKAQKRIPLVIRRKIRPAPQYQFVVPPRLEPDSVTIYGPKTLIDTTKSWTTELLEISDIKEDIKPRVTLNPHPNSEVSFDTTQIVCDIKVEQFTEKTLEVDIQIINAPDTLLLTIHPSKIKITCRVGLSNYDKVDKTQFAAVADFRKVNVNNSNYAPVKITRVPDFVKNTDVQPKDVEFIISR